MISWLMTIKAVLITRGVASVGLFLKDSVPVTVDFTASRAPIMWSSLLSWLKPPYLYVLTNGIIITIVASSKYYRSRSSSHHHDQEDDGGIVYGGDYTAPIVTSPRMLELKNLDPDARLDFAAANPPSQKLEPEESGRLCMTTAKLKMKLDQSLRA